MHAHLQQLLVRSMTRRPGQTDLPGMGLPQPHPEAVPGGLTDACQPPVSCHASVTKHSSPP